jgi:hypothetical protein
MEEKCIFLEEGPGLGQDPGLLGYEFKIPDRTIDVLTSDLSVAYFLATIAPRLHILHDTPLV